MSSEGNTTVPGSLDEYAPGTPHLETHWTLSLGWLREEPHRVGQSCPVPQGSTLMLGRAFGKTPESQLRAPITRFSIVRPGSTVDCGPLGGDRMSQEQARLEYMAIGINLEVVGRAPLLINGERLAHGDSRIVRPGDVLFVPEHSVLLVTRAPASLPADPLLSVLHAFGEPDARGIVGDSLAAWNLRRQIVLAHRVGGPTMLYGDTGTGKELVARALHAQSGRKGPFVPVNCANLVSSLAEWQLFGSLANRPNKGDEENLGWFGMADGGTLFLDEIGELPLHLQAKLLRVLQAGGEYLPIGATEPRRADVLVVAATNRDLGSTIKHDLLPRFPSRVDVPPLSVRWQDVVPLARAFVLRLHREGSQVAARFVGVRPDGAPHVRMSPYFVTAMLRRTYEGNVRELENYVRHAMAESAGELIVPPSDTRPWQVPASVPPPAVAGASTPASPPLPAPMLNADDTTPDGVPAAMPGDEPPRRDPKTLFEAEICDALAACGGVVPAAKFLRVGRDQLRRRMEKLGIDPDKRR
ncbi:MAG TPA: sigma 54-interacting transcriptional regulator [Polyangiaceae bacterium]|jgi:two-component system nitrogen regulation response regulator GlnG/two-component system response regulator HydG